jgi:SNF2 family DNA or RNA helicase
MKFTPVEPQRLFIEHLRNTPDAMGFIGMGIGKTAACLARLNEMFLDGEAVSCLIVAPMRVANLTWPAEVKQWEQFRWMKVANLREEKGQRAFLNGTAHVYLINYEAMNLLVSLVQRRGGTIPYDVVIFDEVTKAKNPSSKRINLYRRKVPRAARHWALTGTPIPNSLLDLFAQVRLIDNGQRLGSNFLEFKKHYFHAPAIPQRPWEAKNFTAATVEEKISDITLTLKSSDWLDLPDMVFEDVEIKFTDELRKKYELLEAELVIELKKDKTINVASAAALVSKLLQFTSGNMYDEDKIVHHIHDLKFDALRALAKKEKQPLFVASIFKHEQDAIREQFKEARFFADAKSIKDQHKMIEDWNTGKIKMLVAHPASVGHGLNLQYGSSVIVWVTLTYSRENYEQMIARLARRGQENLIKIYRLMVPGTVDDAVAEALANKAENEARLISALQMLESYRGNGAEPIEIEILPPSTNIDDY